MPKKSGQLKTYSAERQVTNLSAKHNLLILHVLLITALGILVYSNSFRVPFVFDDYNSIVDNKVIHNMGNFLFNSVGYDYNPRRFIGYLMLALNYRLGGLDVTGYHVFNLSVHIINALLVYTLVMLSFSTPHIKGTALESRSRLIAFFSAALFIVHPVQTEAVTYIIQRLASLAAMFYLGSLCLYIRFRLLQEGGEAVRKSFMLYGLSLVSAVLAMKTKENAFTLPIVIVLYESLFLGSMFPSTHLSSDHRSSMSPRPRVVLYLLPVVVTLLIIPLSMLNLDKPLGQMLSDASEVTVAQSALSRWAYLMTEFRVIVTYIRLLFLPVGQNLDYDYPLYHSLFEPQVAFSFLCLLGLFVLAVVLLRKARQGADPSLRLISFGIMWFFITLSVESGLIPIADVIFEHRVYLPSVGFFVSLVSGVFLIAGKKRVKGISLAAVALTAVVVTFAGAAYARNIVWQSGISLWQDVVEKSPMNARGHNSLGTEYSMLRQYDQAVKELEIAVRLKPDYIDAHSNLGVDYQALNILERAVEESQFVISRDPTNAKAHFNLGVIYYRMGQFELARKELKAGLLISPDEEKARQLLGMISH